MVKESFSLMLDSDIREALDAIATEQRVTVAHIVRQAIYSYLLNKRNDGHHIPDSLPRISA